MINVKIRGPKGVSQLNNLDPNLKISEFLIKIEEISGIKVQNQRLLAGFPPTEIDTSTPEESTLSTKGLKNGDTITVQEKSLANTQATAEAVETGKKRKRETKTKKTYAASAASSGGSNNDGAIIHTLHGRIFGSGTAGKKKSVAKPSGKRQKRADTDQNDELLSEKTARTLEDALIQAVSREANEGDDPLVAFLRSGTQDALKQREQETLATYRYQALLSGKYKFEFKQAYTVGTGAQPFFKISFPTDFGEQVEEQEALTRLELYSIVQLIIQSNEAQQNAAGAAAASSSSSSAPVTAAAPKTDSNLSMELLKPYKMALVGLKLMFPDKDWSFLDNRKREMSDRAKHNEKMKIIYEKLDKEEEITDEDLIAAGLMDPKPAEAQEIEQQKMEDDKNDNITSTDQSETSSSVPPPSPAPL